jgi:hypothetical protein
MIIGATICCLVLWLLKGTLLPMAGAAQFTHLAIIPAKAGTQLFANSATQEPASDLRMNDDAWVDKPKNSCFSNAMGTSVTNSDDANGDGVYDCVQTIIKTINADGSRTDLTTNDNRITADYEITEITVTPHLIDSPRDYGDTSLN